MPSHQDPNKIIATPSKDFFIDMLTKDISLSECILDLLDNSVHGLVANQDLDVMEPLLSGKLPKKSVNNSVSVAFSPSSFSIEDDCGGISIEDARKEVFLLGKPNKSAGAGLGVYGIGMKRAFFKMGKHIVVESNTTDEEFRVDIDVDKWKRDKDNWDLAFTHWRKRAFKHGKTSISIETLLDVPKQLFGSTSFRTLVEDRIATTYALFMKAGLHISVNKKKLTADIPAFATSKDLTVVRYVGKKQGVDILILAGSSPKDDRTPRGWYVFCNGRCVLAADKTERTGWGSEGTPGFHPKYNHFLGFLYMRSTDVQKLPWTTSKEGIDRESVVYQYALAQMRTQTRPVLSLFDRIYASDIRVEGAAEYKVLTNARATPIEKVSGVNSAFTVRTTVHKDTEPVSIQYKKSKKEVDKARKAIGNPRMSASRVGEHTFDWYLKRNSS